MDFCTDYNFLNGVLIIKFIFQAALIILPIVIIIMGSIDAFKAVTSGKSDQLKAILTNCLARAASFLIIMMLPTLIHIAFNMMDGYDGIYNELTKCMNNANTDVIEGLKRAKEQQLKGMETPTTLSYLAKYNKDKYVKRQTAGTSATNASQVSGQGNFVKYNLTDEQIKYLANVTMNEQGSLVGYAAEASLFANRFEGYGASFGEGADGLVNYVKSSHWWPPVSLNTPQNVTDEIFNAVKAVLVDGKRTLPGYVDEQVYIGAIASVSNDGVSFDVMDKSKYIQFKTKVQQDSSVGSGTFTFYAFPDDVSDPFGYTSEERRNQIGDDCYSLSQIT